MPRGARLDAPGTLHHVIIRGIEKGDIVRDDEDRKEFLRRMGELAQGMGTGIYAFALMTNHAHILLKSGGQGLSTYMRRLLSGYAQYSIVGIGVWAISFRTDINRSSVKKRRTSINWWPTSI